MTPSTLDVTTQTVKKSSIQWKEGLQRGQHISMLAVLGLRSQPSPESVGVLWTAPAPRRPANGSRCEESVEVRGGRIGRQ